MVVKYLTLILLVYVHSATVCALQINYEAEAGLEYSDNITRVNEDTISQETGILYFNGTINHQTPNVALNIQPILTYRHYAGETFDDQLFVTLNAALLWDILPKRFSWSLENYLDQTPIQATDAFTPFNRQDTNIFMTGPNLRFNINQNRAFELLVRYADIYYETSNTDNERYGGILKFVSQPNSYQTYALNIDAVDIRYDDDLINENYNRNDAYLTFNRVHSTYEYNIDAGYTLINFENDTDLDGPYFNILYNYILNTRSNINFQASSGYTDSSRNFLLSRAIREAISRYDTSISGLVFKENYGSLEYNWVYERTNFNSGIYFADQDYDDENEILSRKLKYLVIRFTRSLTRLLSLYATARVTESDYTSTDRIDDDQDYSIGIRHRLSRSLFLRLDYRRALRDSTDDTSDYLENVGYISIGYRNRQ